MSRSQISKSHVTLTERLRALDYLVTGALQLRNSRQFDSEEEPAKIEDAFKERARRISDALAGMSVGDIRRLIEELEGRVTRDDKP